MRRSATGQSCASPPVSKIARRRPLASASAWIFVFRPPRERPAQRVFVSQSGPIELAISNAQYTCPRANQPDMPVHVYRALNNELRIFATNASNYPFISPPLALDALRNTQ